MKNKNNNAPKYVGSIEVKLNRIEVFSFSNSSCPFYTITFSDGKIVTIGGAISGGLSRIDDLIFDARDFHCFASNVAWYIEKGESLTDYEFAKSAHRVVADTGWFEKPARVLIDLYDNGQVGLGASDCLYLKDKDGKIGIHIDEVQLREMFL